MKVFGHNGKIILVNGKAIRVPAPPILYSFIDPIDPIAFPTHNGLKMLTLDGTEDWTYSGGAVYTSDFQSTIRGQRRDSVVGYAADYEFLPAVQGIASMSDKSFVFNGTSSDPVNGNLSFKDGTRTASVAEWTAYLAEHPVTILISVNNPDASVWKPAKRYSDGVTGFWNGESGFVAVYGGIPYLGENLLTEYVIQNYFDAWIGSNYAWASAGDSASVKIPVEVGKRYHLAWNTAEECGTIFRYGFAAAGATPGGTTLAAPRARTSPQDVPAVDVLASNAAIIVQASAPQTDKTLRFYQLSIREMIGGES